jgi:hypothetical protein
VLHNHGILYWEFICSVSLLRLINWVRLIPCHRTLFTRDSHYCVVVCLSTCFYFCDSLVQSLCLCARRCGSRLGKSPCVFIFCGQPLLLHVWFFFFFFFFFRLLEWHDHSFDVSLSCLFAFILLLNNWSPPSDDGIVSVKVVHDVAVGRTLEISSAVPTKYLWSATILQNS